MRLSDRDLVYLLNGLQPGLPVVTSMRNFDPRDCSARPTDDRGPYFYVDPYPLTDHQERDEPESYNPPEPAIYVVPVWDDIYTVINEWVECRDYVEHNWHLLIHRVPVVLQDTGNCWQTALHPMIEVYLKLQWPEFYDEATTLARHPLARLVWPDYFANFLQAGSLTV